MTATACVAIVSGLHVLLGVLIPKGREPQLESGGVKLANTLRGQGRPARRRLGGGQWALGQHGQAPLRLCPCHFTARLRVTQDSSVPCGDRPPLGDSCLSQPLLIQPQLELGGQAGGRAEVSSWDPEPLTSQGALLRRKAGVSQLETSSLLGWHCGKRGGTHLEKALTGSPRACLQTDSLYFECNEAENGKGT